MSKVIVGGWLPLSLLACWEALGRMGYIEQLFFPVPSLVFETARQMIASGELIELVGSTLWMALLGFLVGSGFGLLTGFLMGGVDFIRRTLDPIISAAWASPKLTLLPMLMLIFGLGDLPRVLLVSIGCFVLTSLHTADAVRNVPRIYLDLARNYGSGGWELVRKVYWPATLPQVFTALRLSTGRALTITIAVELVTATDGLGSLIWMSWQSFLTERLYVGILTAASLGMSIHVALRSLEGYVVPWEARRHGLL